MISRDVLFCGIFTRVKFWGISTEASREIPAILLREIGVKKDHFSPVPCPATV